MSWLQRQMVSLQIAWRTYLRDIEWRRHKKTLTDVEIASLDDGSHASLSHDRDVKARKLLPSLKEELRSRSLIGKVELGYYHMNRLIFVVDFAKRPPNPKQLPRFFHGFEVSYNWPELHKKQ
ncbi:MAG: hypothetical protein AAF586_05915 [Planctomycetota bacterium]